MFDLIVIGSGVAGLTAVLSASPSCRVALITKQALDDGSTRYAQGGIAVAIADDDSAQEHFDDTMAAGRGLCDPAAVRVLVEEAPARLRDLASWGVGFDAEKGRLAVGREAAHSRARIVHAGGDSTGLALQTALSQRVRSLAITVVEHVRVCRLLLDARDRCCGVWLRHADGSSTTVRAAATVLATGGASSLWRNSTNPKTSTGDGVALAFAAGADVASMEFEQFHPTALALPGAQRFLISEAVRGEGATVIDTDGVRFLFDHHPSGELAGRDVVSRAIWDHMRQRGDDHVLLDCTPIDADRMLRRFPTIVRTCAEHGIDVTRQPIPIAPAAHYTIGGVRTDLHGATSVAGLYACGEVASTGVHGANRLASNSLLESLVFGRRAAKAALSDTAELPAGEPLDDSSHAAPGGSPAGAWDRLRDVMWEHAGLVRTGNGLRTALATCEEIASTAAPGDAGLVDAAATAALVCRSGIAREESRGAHFRADFPETASDWHGVIVMQHERREDRVDHA